MPSLAWTVRQVGPTLVELLVTNDSSPVRVRIANRLDGPVWPPRRRGVPERGWDDDGVTCSLAAGETRAIGYATPASPDDPPAEIVRTTPVPPDEGDPSRFGRSTNGLDCSGVSTQRELAEVPDGDADIEVPDRASVAEVPDRASVAEVPNVSATPAGVARVLGDPRPPRDAVPPDRAGAIADTPDGHGPATETRDVADGHGPATETRDVAVPETDEGQIPDSVATWLADVEQRVSRAEALAGARALDVAGEQLVGVGGVTGARRLVEQVQHDETTLRAVAERAEALAERTRGVDVPLSAYRRLRR